MTYDELVTAVSDYTQNTYLKTDIDTFIQQAEQRIYNAVQLPALRKNVTGALTVNNPYLSAPTDFLAVFSLAVIDSNGAYQYILNKDVNFMRAAYPLPTYSSIPKFYAIWGPQTSTTTYDETSFILAPTPDQPYTVELHYYAYPDSIVTVGKTWLGENFDTALFNMVMMEAITFMKGEQDLVALYQKRADESMALLKQMGDSKNKEDAYRSGMPRYKTT